MTTRILSALAISLTLAVGAAPAALACGDEHHDAARPVPADAQTVTLKVGGMTCGGCAELVRNALLKVDGVYDAVVDWEAGVDTVKLDGKKFDEAKLDDAIAKAGYKVEKPSKG